MRRVADWIKNNKLSAFLILILAYILLKSFYNPFGYMLNSGIGGMPETGSFESFDSSVPAAYSPKAGYSRTTPETPQLEITDRKVVRNSNLSLVVKDVRDAMDKIEQETTIKKGYMVNSNINRPEEGASGTIEIRIPSTELKPFLNFLRTLSIKVVSESVTGSDITDQYVDIQARLDILSRNKTTYMAILDKATTIDEIMRVQTQIFSLQNQIDSYQGQLKYMEGVSSSSLITVYLSTDELSLPYAPDNAWRPQVVFKQAVSSILSDWDSDCDSFYHYKKEVFQASPTSILNSFKHNTSLDL